MSMSDAPVLALAWMAGVALGHPRPGPCRSGHRLPAGLGGEIVLRGKMAVEAAMGQPGPPHHVGHRHPFETLFAEQLAGGIEDALAVLGELLAADFHGRASGAVSTPERMGLTGYMIVDMNNQS